MIRGIHELFVTECNGWDQAGDFDIQLYDAVLRNPVGEFPSGTVVDCLILWLMDEDEPSIELCFDDKRYKFPINFSWTFGTLSITEN